MSLHKKSRMFYNLGVSEYVTNTQAFNMNNVPGPFIFQMFKVMIKAFQSFKSL